MPSSGLLIVSVGHVSPRKGFQRVIRILPRLAEHHPDVTFAIVGGAGAETFNQPALHRLACEVGMANHVRFVGACSPNDVVNWLCAADLFVLASDFEACPNVIWEALACGRPVVATRVGLVEYMVPPFAGILFDDPEDAEQLLEAVCSAIQRTWNADRIRAHAVAHAWDKIADRISLEFRRAIGDYERQNLHAPSMNCTTS
jgi:glycosyltransferase involved in cell wall biosynthesis